ncbi:AfsR/SARP family transcriptional regulator [Micromonospora inyonensis]|uniref:DNA-binding transcriptional activator of the SARP family n=1 Tax=Micromonospora inyonensis TaxID=47866 RepID=A0A1C6RF05_9ACTN|nr:AfsR/SARP family transcriptional regulator [Micromonospora inyonensis]SCL15741.1 DNA-binding transcriptional activator of the SARP family [Micromonospora inyonensis]
MDYYFLGPSSIKIDGAHISLPGPRTRNLLAALLITPNKTVSVDRLIDAVWNQQPPATARQQVQNRLGRLRRLLAPIPNQQIVRVGGGYRLEVDEDRIDGHKFRALWADADRARRSSRLDHSIKLLRDSLSLWRGSALEDIDSQKLRAQAVRWEEDRIKVIETLIELEFTRSRHCAVTGDLQGWIHHYPYHEALHCRLAEALHMACRTAEALEVLRQLMARMTTVSTTREK